jgi:phosphoglycolate phosphatase-like HAD superfamily hydrolase
VYGAYHLLTVPYFTGGRLQFGVILQRLVLFDVDGTLLRAGEAGPSSFDRAVASVLGVTPTERPHMAGKTDRQIVGEYLESLGVARTPQVVSALLEALADALAVADSRGDIRSGGSALPGVAALLERLAGDDRVLSSLLTGNVVPNAKRKTAAFGLDTWLDFEVGAYGSDHHDRNQLVPVALRRLQDRRDVTLKPSDVWVVGDTPRDLACARAGGVRCLLVATGGYSLADLEPLGADVTLKDLSDTDSVQEIFTSGL